MSFACVPSDGAAKGGQMLRKRHHRNHLIDRNQICWSWSQRIPTGAICSRIRIAKSMVQNRMITNAAAQSEQSAQRLDTSDTSEIQFPMPAFSPADLLGCRGCLGLLHHSDPGTNKGFHNSLSSHRVCNQPPKNAPQTRIETVSARNQRKFELGLRF